MALWNIQESETVREQLEYYRADKAVTHSYLQFVKELARSGNPASMGITKKGRRGYCHVTHISKFILDYRIDYAARSIDLLNMSLWNIQESETVREQLEYYRADKAVTHSYLQFVKELARSGNPASMGSPKKGRHHGAFGRRITKSVRLVYRICYAARRIDLVNLGDHKRVYGRGG